MKKIWISLCLLAALCCSFLATTVSAADYSAYCEFCGRDVTWTPITSNSQKMTDTNGHYYMTKSLAMTNQTIAADNTVCLLLNGKAYTANKTITVSSGATLNIQGSGELVGRSTENYDHGAVWVKEGGTLNLRNTEVTFEYLAHRDGYLQTGGLICTEGTVNAVNCTMSGGYAAVAGGNVYIAGTGLLNLDNTTITGGTAPTGNCIYSSGRIQLSGNASVENILAVPADGGPALGEMLTVKGTYTGSVGITLPETIADGADIGNLVDSGNIAGATLRIANKELTVTANGTNLVTQAPPAASVDGTAYPTLNQAISAAAEGQTVKLEKSLDAATIGKSVVLDLNGCDLGSLTVTGDATVSLADSQTADFTVQDGNYGKIGTIDGSTVPYTDGSICYLPVQELNGISYHALAFSVNKMTLRPEASGLFFKSSFQGDEKAAALLDSFGVAMSLSGAPSNEDLQNPTHFTSFSPELINKTDDSTSTLLQNILKPDNGYNTNQRNAAIRVYGRPYVKLTNGTVLWGATKTRSLREQIEGINNKEADLTWLNDAQATDLSSLYFKYQRVMKSWDTEKIHTLWQAEEENTLKVLAITSSFGLNTTQLIHEIAAAEGKDVTVGRLYASGCTLEKHVNSFKGNLPTYKYTKNNGTWTTVEDATMAYGLADEYWDVIFIQQSAAQSPLVETYKDYIDQLMAHVQKHIPNPNARYIWNMTWAYQSDSDQKVFVETFNRDQMAMYNSILNAVQEKVVPRTDFDAIIPSGTAIQNARTSYFGDNLTKDTYHLNNLGRAIAGYTLYAVLTGERLTEVNLGPVNSYDLPAYLNLTDADRQVIIESVNNALDNPWEVTPSQYPTAE